MRRLFRDIHLWLSVPFGIVVTLICFSGAMLVFEKEITRLVRPELYYVEQAGARPLPVGQVAGQVASTLPPDVQVTGVTVCPDPKCSYQVNLSKPKRASVFVNPYTGEELGRYERLPFFRTMFSLHRWLLGSRPEGGGIFWGKTIVGISTLLFVAVLLSGVVLWWPRTKKALANSLKLTLRKGWRRFWYSLHVAGGMYALLLLAVMALTGLTWSFGWYRTGFYSLFGAETRAQQSSHGDSSPQRQERNKPDGSESETTFAHWEQVVKTLQERNPGHAQITVADGNATVAFSRLGNQRASDRYTFDPLTGELQDAEPYETTPRQGKLRGWIYSVHVGSFGGTATRVLWFLAALLGASLPLTGYYLWIKRLTGRRKRPHLTA